MWLTNTGRDRPNAEVGEGTATIAGTVVTARPVGPRFWLLGWLPGLGARAVRAADRGCDKCLKGVATFVRVQRAILRRTAVAPLTRRGAALALGSRGVALGASVSTAILAGPLDAAHSLRSDQHLYK